MLINNFNKSWLWPAHFIHHPQSTGQVHARVGLRGDLKVGPRNKASVWKIRILADYGFTHTSLSLWRMCPLMDFLSAKRLSSPLHHHVFLLSPCPISPSPPPLPGHQPPPHTHTYEPGPAQGFLLLKRCFRSACGLLGIRLLASVMHLESILIVTDAIWIKLIRAWMTRVRMEWSDQYFNVSLGSRRGWRPN